MYPPLPPADRAPHIPVSPAAAEASNTAASAPAIEPIGALAAKRVVEPPTQPEQPTLVARPPVKEQPEPAAPVVQLPAIPWARVRAADGPENEGYEQTPNDAGAPNDEHAALPAAGSGQPPVPPVENNGIGGAAEEPEEPEWPTQTMPDVYDARHFMPPTPETRADFTAALTELKPFASHEHTRGAAVDHTNPTTGSRVKMVCSEETFTDTTGEVISGTTTYIQTTVDGTSHRFTPTDPKIRLDEAPKLKPLIRSAAKAQPDRAQAAWVRKLHASVASPDPTRPREAVVRDLLADAPATTHFEHSQYVCSVKPQTLDGARATIAWKELSGPIPPDTIWREDSPLVSVKLTTPDGEEYQYRQRVNGDEELHISRPAQDVRPELDHDEPYAYYDGDLIIIQPGENRDDPAIAQEFRDDQAAALRRDLIAEQGAATVTDAKLAHMAAVVRTAAAKLRIRQQRQGRTEP